LVTIIQETDYKIIDKLKEYFVEDGCETKDKIAYELENLMKLYPDQICVLVGYLFDQIVGFLIAYSIPTRGYAYIYEAFSIVEGEDASRGMAMIFSWARHQGLTEVRFETNRESVLMITAQKYGFSEHSIVMSRQI
jgi:hypothetical protein